MELYKKGEVMELFVGKRFRFFGEFPQCATDPHVLQCVQKDDETRFCFARFILVVPGGGEISVCATFDAHTHDGTGVTLEGQMSLNCPYVHGIGTLRISALLDPQKHSAVIYVLNGHDQSCVVSRMIAHSNICGSCHVEIDGIEWR